MTALLVILSSVQQAPALSDLPALVSQLGSDEPQERDEATAVLRKAGVPALQTLRRALAESKDPEARLRLQSIIRTIARPTFIFQRSIDAGRSPEEPRDAVWSPDGRQLAVPLRDHVVVYGTEGWRPLHVHKGTDLVPLYNAKGDRLALAEPKKEGIVLLSTHTFAPVEMDWGDKPRGLPLIFDEKSYVVAEVGEDSLSIRRFALSKAHGRLEGLIRHEPRGFTSARLAACPDHRWVAASTVGGQRVNVWSSDDGAKQINLRAYGPGESTMKPAFSPDSSLLASNDCGFITLWRTVDWSEADVKVSDWTSDQLAFRNDSQFIIAGGRADRIVALDTQVTGKDSLVAEIKLEPPVEHPGIFSIHASPVDDRFILLWVKDWGSEEQRLELSVYRLVSP